mmetsp:Transcript_38592/g.70177  ORF Transcript_38592/g.70177 Transcript_38592/m.70177 type:complete len:508 (+) Transcript_38592:91-1614(+)
MAAALSTAARSDGFVIRNTFLELTDETLPPMPETRRRAVSDYTDSRRERTWSSGSDQSGCDNVCTPAVSSVAVAGAQCAGPLKRMGTCETLDSRLEAVLEGESDTDAPDDEEFDRSHSLTDGSMGFGATSSSVYFTEDGRGESSGELNAAMLELLKDEDVEGRDRARTSSTIFWVGHEPDGYLTLVDEDGLPCSEKDVPNLSESARPSLVSVETGLPSPTADEVSSSCAPTQDQSVPAPMSAYVGSCMASVWTTSVPWYMCQSVKQSSPSAPVHRDVADDVATPTVSPPLLHQADSSSSLDMTKSESRHSMDVLPGTDARVEVCEEQEGQRSKRKPRRRGQRHNVWQSSTCEESIHCDPTTVMLRNLPNRYTRKMFLRLLDHHGFRGHYNFVYLPIDFRHKVNLGYAFVNTVTHEAAVRLKDSLDGFSSWTFDSLKVCEAVWASPHQGLADNVERYRNSPVMHESVSDEFKPLLFEEGVRITFPPPTRAIRSPKVRMVPSSSSTEHV